MTTGPAAAGILVVLHDLALGGTERTAVRLAGAWARSGRRVRLLCGRAEGQAAALLDPRVEVVACHPPIPRGVGSRGRLGRALARELAARPADVLFVPGNFHWPVIGPAARLPSPPAVVAQLSNPLHRPDRPAAWRAWLSIRARRRLAGADALVTLTPAQAREADRLLGRAVSRHIPLPVLDDVPPAATTPTSGEEVVFLGRLVRQKRPDLALRAFARLPRPDARLVLVGDGPRRAALGRLARRLGVADRVVFAGVAEEARPWLERARVLVLPSDYEGYGAVVVEALAAGRPVVASDRVPAAVELVDRPARGRVTSAGDVAALAAALEAVISQPPAPGEPLLPDASRFLLGEVATAYLALFDELAAKRGATRRSVQGLSGRRRGEVIGDISLGRGPAAR